MHAKTIHLRESYSGTDPTQSSSVESRHCCRFLAMSPPSSARGLTVVVVLAVWSPQLGCTARASAISSASANQRTNPCYDTCKVSNSTVDFHRCQQQCSNQEPAPRARSKYASPISMMTKITPPWCRVVKWGCSESNTVWVKGMKTEHAECLKKRSEGHTMQFRYEL